jgi:hypothetical protein
VDLDSEPSLIFAGLTRKSLTNYDADVVREPVFIERHVSVSQKGPVHHYGLHSSADTL